MITVLPPNASEQEKNLEIASHYPLDPTIIRGAKFVPLNEIMPWLLYEYSLGEISIWLPDPKLAIEQGVYFHRIKGTPKALRMALSWANINDIIIEEEPPGEHFAEFQVGIPDDVPNDFFVDSVVGLARLAAPARSRLMRMYNHLHDIRRFKLDHSQWGDLLSDYSGVRIDNQDPVLSFGRINNFNSTASDILLKNAYLREYYNAAISDDLYRLDVAIIDESPHHVPNRDMILQRLSVFKNLDQLFVAKNPLITWYGFIKAQIVLSEQSELGAINSCFPAKSDTEIGRTAQLDEDLLSLHLWEIFEEAILERKTLEHEHNTENIFSFEPASLMVEQEYGAHLLPGRLWPSLSDSPLSPWLLNSSNQADQYFTSDYPGTLLWHEHPHLNRPWTDQSPIVNITHN